MGTLDQAQIKCAMDNNFSEKLLNIKVQCHRETLITRFNYMFEYQSFLRIKLSITFTIPVARNYYILIG
jgi:hypothetical protein